MKKQKRGILEIISNDFILCGIINLKSYQTWIFDNDM